MLPNGWVLSVGADITALKKNEKSLRQAHEAAHKASRTDQLKGLPNRRHILGLLDEALAANEGTTPSCLEADLVPAPTCDQADGRRQTFCRRARSAYLAAG